VLPHFPLSDDEFLAPWDDDDSEAIWDELVGFDGESDEKGLARDDFST